MTTVTDSGSAPSRPRKKAANANGSTFETNTVPRRLEPMPAFLFWNERGEFFRDLAPWNRSLSTAHVSRGLAVADYDNDGAMDIVVVDHDGGVRLLRNDIPHGNWIELLLRSRTARGPVGFGDGATVVAWVSGAPLRRTVTSASYLSQDGRRVHIGIGPARTVDRLEVQWLGGRVETWSQVEANRIWDVTEGDVLLRPLAPRQQTTSQPPGGQVLVEFWARQRAAMDALKQRGEVRDAARLFRDALAIDSAHEDSRTTSPTAWPPWAMRPAPSLSWTGRSPSTRRVIAGWRVAAPSLGPRPLRQPNSKRRGARSSRRSA